MPKLRTIVFSFDNDIPFNDDGFEGAAPHSPAARVNQGEWVESKCWRCRSRITIHRTTEQNSPPKSDARLCNACFSR
jgi:hypothetical protein